MKLELPKYDVETTGYVKTASNEFLWERRSDLANLLMKNEHPILDQLKPFIFGEYKVKAKFIYKGFNGDRINCGGKTLAVRRKNSLPIEFSKGVILIEGTPLKHSGSNKYPTVRFVDDWCILEFTCQGLPDYQKINGWEVEIIELEVLNAKQGR